MEKIPFVFLAAESYHQIKSSSIKSNQIKSKLLFPFLQQTNKHQEIKCQKNKHMRMQYGGSNPIRKPLRPEVVSPWGKIFK